jgi:hypothetical protein
VTIDIPTREYRVSVIITTPEPMSVEDLEVAAAEFGGAAGYVDGREVEVVAHVNAHKAHEAMRHVEDCTQHLGEVRTVTATWGA